MILAPFSIADLLGTHSYTSRALNFANSFMRPIFTALASGLPSQVVVETCMLLAILDRAILTMELIDIAQGSVLLGHAFDFHVLKDGIQEITRESRA